MRKQATDADENCFECFFCAFYRSIEKRREKNIIITRVFSVQGHFLTHNFTISFIKPRGRRERSIKQVLTLSQILKHFLTTKRIHSRHLETVAGKPLKRLDLLAEALSWAI
jgi:hypothetical protein